MTYLIAPPNLFSVTKLEGNLYLSKGKCISQVSLWGFLWATWTDNVPVFVRVTQQTEMELMELSVTQFHFTGLFQLHFPVIPPYLTSSVQY